MSDIPDDPDDEPILSTADCGARIGVSSDFVVRQIRDGYLAAFAFQSGKRTIYRVSERAWRDYLEGRSTFR